MTDNSAISTTAQTLSPQTAQHRQRAVVLPMALCCLFMAVTATISTLGLYEYPRHGSHLTVIITVLTPTLLYGLAFLLSPAVRRWTQRDLNLAMLTLPHAWRTVGFSFLALWFYGILPAGFGAPAGFGDFIIAIAAPFVAVGLWLHWRHAIRSAVVFHLLGLLDLVIALVTGMTGFGVPASGMNAIDPMTAFPMVIVPAVFVPLLIWGHVLVLTKITMDHYSPQAS